MAKEKGKATKATKKKAQFAEKARLVVEKKLTEIKVKLGGTKLKLAEVESLNLAHVDEIVDLKAPIETCEEKWYNKGFANAENSVEPIVHQARHHGFGKGWLVALQVIGVAEDFPLRNPKQIPYPASPPPVQSQVGATDEEDTPSMRELVCAIDTHVEMAEDVQAQPLLTDQLIEDALERPAKDAAQLLPTDPSV